MSGKKQHHIPQSLQRGFLFDVEAEKTYVHRRNGGNFPASIADVAAQRYFYSRLSTDGSKTLDDKITDYENRLGGLLIELRKVAIDGEVKAETAAEVIAHLTPRSANMRRIFGSGLQQLLTAAASAFADEETVTEMLGLAEPEPNPTWNGHFDRILDKSELRPLLELLPIPMELLNRVFFMVAREHLLGSYDAQMLGVKEAFTSMLDSLDDKVREGHNKALGETLVAQSRKESLEALRWHVRQAPPEGAILPDCVAIGVDQQGTEFIPYMMTKAATVSIVVMPITSEKLLVGIRPSTAAPDLNNFNRDAAACSDELFITPSSAPLFSELGANMGERWLGEIDAVIKGVLDDVLPAKQLSGGGVDQQPKTPIGYQLSFNGLGETEADVAALSEKTQRLISQIHPLFDLERLDGITYSAGFQAAIEGTERGFDTNASLEANPDEIAQGASVLSVVRDGVLKVRIVLNAEYGISLVGEEAQDAEVALHLLVAGLAQADTILRIEKALPGFLMEPVYLTDHDAVLHCALRKAVRAYRYARDSAEFGADSLVEQEFTKYLVWTFDNASAAIAKAKDEHAASPDFRKLLDASIVAAGDMLTAAARLIGHRHGMENFEFPAADTAAGAAIGSRELTSWVDVFAKDLRRFWRMDTWTRADFYALNIHAERMLWPHGIILTRAPHGQGTLVYAAPPPSLAHT